MGLMELLRPRGRRCPRDGARLARVEKAGAVAERCARCGGIWIDAQRLRRVADRSDIARADAWAGDYPAPSGFACPACAGACCGTFLEDFSVHTCVACHGVWIDPKEVAGARRRLHVEEASRAGRPELRAFLARL